MVLSHPARILFIGLISNADDEGRIKASPRYLKAIIFPSDEVDLNTIAKWRDEVTKQKLVVLYIVDEMEYIYLPTYSKYQYINKRMSGNLPPPVTNDCGTTTALLPHHDNPIGIGIGIGTGIGVEDGKGSNNKTLMDSLLKLPRWENSHIKEDQAWLTEFLIDYPELNVGFIKACRDYHSNKKSHSKASWKNRLRNWIINERKYKEKHGQDRKGTRELPDRKTGYTPAPTYEDDYKYEEVQPEP